jgi:predicted TIM-barrel fold metal-dependent hydrolase
VHEALASPVELKPYLPKQWQRMTDEVGWRGPFASQRTMLDFAPALSETPARTLTSGVASFDTVKSELLDRYPASRFILTSRFWPAGTRRQPEFHSAAARAYNDWLVDQWLSRDDRLLGSVCLPTDPASAVLEIHRMASQSRMVQVLFPVGGFEWAETEYHPVFEAAYECGFVCAFHATHHTPGSLPAFGTRLAQRTALPHAYQVQMLALIHNGVFARCPGLKVLLLESGFTWLPYVQYRLERTWRAVRVETPWVDELATTLVERHVWFGTHPLETKAAPEELMDIIRMVKLESKLVFASGYPGFDSDTPELMAAHVPDSLHSRLLLDNARALYADRLATT